MAHEMVPRRSSPTSRYATLLSHSDENLDTRNTSSTNQTPPTNVDGRWYGPVMKISAMTHGTVDHGGSNCGPEKNLEGFKQVQTRSTSLDLEGRQRTDGTGLCCLGGRLGQTRYLE